MARQALEDSIIDDVIKSDPNTVRVLLDYRTRRPGCLLEPFMTVREAAEEFGVEAASLADDLQNAIEADVLRDPSAYRRALEVRL